MAFEAFVPKKFAPGSQRIIDTANEIMAEYARQGYDLSLRQLYYQFVSRDILPNRQSEYKRLGSIISDARLAGLIDWSMISDRGRVVVANSHWGTPADMMRSAAQSYRIDKWQRQPTYVEVMVEKQALEGVLIPVCEELDIRFTANKGYSSSSAMYEASKRFVQAHRQGKAPYVLYLGDHDPSGIDMTRDIDERLDLFTYQWGVKVNRLALNYDQVEEYEPPENPVKLTDSRAGGYCDRFGDSSWELDALEPSILASLVEDAVLGLRDEELWEEAVEREERERKIMFSLADRYENGEIA